MLPGMSQIENLSHTFFLLTSLAHSGLAVSL